MMLPLPLTCNKENKNKFEEKAGEGSLVVKECGSER
jgi:hypothetical protein